MRLHLALVCLLAVFGLCSVTSQAAGSQVADQVVIVDIRSSQFDYWDRLAFTSLQGIVNRDKARLYLIWEQSDWDWLNEYRADYGVSASKLSNPWNAFDRFSSHFEGYAIVDIADPDTANIGANYAAMNDLVPLARHIYVDRQATLPNKPTPNYANLRGDFAGRSKQQTYAWARNNQWPDLNQQLLCNLNTTERAIDISGWTHDRDTIYLRFEDPTPGDGHGVWLDLLRVIGAEGGTLRRIEPNRASEQGVLMPDYSNGTYTRGHSRVADKDAYFTYKLDNVRDAQLVYPEIFNQYRISIADGPGGGGTGWQTVVEDRVKFDQWIINNDPRDYIIARGGAFIDLSSRPGNPEAGLKRLFMEDMPAHSQIWGWHRKGLPESHLVRQASETNNTVLCSNSTPNFSFHQHIQPNDPANYSQPQPEPAEVEVDDSKIYLAFILSDGDSLNFVSDRMHGDWDKPQRGAFPFNWEMQPLMRDFAPAMLEIYYNDAVAGKDWFLASASGIGYFYPDRMSEADLRSRLQVTRPYLNDLDMTSLELLPQTPYPNAGLGDLKAQIYADELGDVLHGVAEGYFETNHPRTSYRVMNTLSWAPNKIGGAHSKEQLRDWLNDYARNHTARPLFLAVHVAKGRIRIEDAKWAADRLDADYKVVGADELFIAHQKTAGRLVRRANGDYIGQVGRVSISQSGQDQWHALSHDRSWSSPVTFFGPPSYQGFDPLNVRLTQVTSDRTVFQLDEWDYMDGGHAAETMGYLTLEAGDYQLADGENGPGTDVEVGRVQTNHEWASVTFNRNFDAAPTVICQVQTTEGPAAVVPRLRNVSASGFEVRLQEEEASPDPTHATEAIGYLAVERGTGMGEMILRSGKTEKVLGKDANGVPKWRTIRYKDRTDFASPVLLAQTMTFDGNNPVALRHRNLDGESVQMFLEEERSADAETAHGIGETVGWVLFDSTAPMDLTTTTGVVARHVFYNDSYYDGDDPAINAADDAAIDPSKEPLMPGESASFANYTSYEAGLNGLMIDIQAAQPPSRLSASDFVFRQGNSNDPASWSAAPDPAAIVVREGAGVNASDRVVLKWNAAQAVKKQWLQVRVKANNHTNLVSDDVFYFGNAIGETGNDSSNASVNAFDVGAVRDNAGGFFNREPVTSAYDINRDGLVNAFDLGLARDNSTGFFDALKLITPPG